MIPVQANPLALLPDLSRLVVMLERELTPHCLWLAGAIVAVGVILRLILPAVLRLRHDHGENTSGSPTIPRTEPQRAPASTPAFASASRNSPGAKAALLDGRPEPAGEVTPILLDLVDLADDMADLKSRATAGLVQEYSFLEGRLFDIFEKHNGQILRSSDWDPDTQRAIKVEPAADEHAEIRVLRTGASGLRVGNRIVRKQEVVLSKPAHGEQQHA